MIVNTPAIVLKSFSYGESSLIARCFSKNNGKVSLIIKGAKSSKSPKASYFQPLSYIDIIYNYKLNRELQVLSKVNFREYWSKILNDPAFSETLKYRDNVALKDKWRNLARK